MKVRLVYVFIRRKIYSLQTFIHNHQDDLRLGGASSRGLGRVKITAKSPVDAKALKPSVEERINKFQKKLHQRWEEWKRIYNHPLEDWLQIERISPSIYNLMLF